MYTVYIFSTDPIERGELRSLECNTTHIHKHLQYLRYNFEFKDKLHQKACLMKHSMNICLSEALKLESALVIALGSCSFSTCYLTSCRCHTRQLQIACISIQHKCSFNNKPSQKVP